MIKNRYTDEIREICTEAINNFIKITDTVLDVVSRAVISGNSVQINRYSLFMEHQHIVNQTEEKLNILNKKVIREQKVSRNPELYTSVLSSVNMAYFSLKLAFDTLDTIYNKSHDNKARLFDNFNQNLNSSIRSIKSGIDYFKSLDAISRRL
ncbi:MULTISPECIES: hypothetical protein [Methanobacterium]|uniref:Uncharacterized protein n=1 Tax=Methanobacterium veterum TaxID=408577 RepID=A0A9E5A5S0_9EURY|nr:MULTISPECIES: hypothetical protein [Methanobacterium]MCZ3367256.1 hypothetical protein [Methanobacterium veterum]MCZ3373596.1 hypothetical protein [Methanobacterium veterum]